MGIFSTASSTGQTRAWRGTAPLLAFSAAVLWFGPAASQCRAQTGSPKPPEERIAEGLALWNKGMGPRLRSLVGNKTPETRVTVEAPRTNNTGKPPEPVSEPPGDVSASPTPGKTKALEGLANSLEVGSGRSGLRVPESTAPKTTADAATGSSNAAAGRVLTSTRIASGPATLAVAEYIPFALAFRPESSLLTVTYLKRESLGTETPHGPLASFAVSVQGPGPVKSVRVSAGTQSSEASAPAALSYSADGSYLLALTDDGKVVIWQVVKGVDNLTYRNPVPLPAPTTTAFARAVAFAPTTDHGGTQRCSVAYQSGAVWTFTVTPPDEATKPPMVQRDERPTLECGRDVSRLAYTASGLLLAASPNPEKRPGGNLYWARPNAPAAAPYVYERHLLWMGADSLGLPLLVTGDTSEITVVRFVTGDPAQGVFVVPLPDSAGATPRTANARVVPADPNTPRGQVSVAVGYDNGRVRFWDATGTSPKSVEVLSVTGGVARTESVPAYNFREQKSVVGNMGQSGAKVYAVAFGQVTLDANGTESLPVLAATMSDRTVYVWPLPWIIGLEADGAANTRPAAEERSPVR